MRLRSYSEAKAMLLAAGYREREARWELSKLNPERIQPVPHKMHSRSLWSPAVIERWIADRQQRLTVALA